MYVSFFRKFMLNTAAFQVNLLLELSLKDGFLVGYSWGEHPPTNFLILSIKTWGEQSGVLFATALREVGRAIPIPALRRVWEHA